MYFLHSLDTLGAWSWLVPGTETGSRAGALTAKKLLDSGTPVAVCERGLDREGAPCSRGVVGEAAVGEAMRGECTGVAVTVW